MMNFFQKIFKKTFQLCTFFCNLDHYDSNKPVIFGRSICAMEQKLVSGTFERIENCIGKTSIYQPNSLIFLNRKIQIFSFCVPN